MPNDSAVGYIPNLHDAVKELRCLPCITLHTVHLLPTQPKSIKSTAFFRHWYPCHDTQSTPTVCFGWTQRHKRNSNTLWLPCNEIHIRGLTPDLTRHVATMSWRLPCSDEKEEFWHAPGQCSGGHDTHVESAATALLSRHISIS